MKLLKKEEKTGDIFWYNKNKYQIICQSNANFSTREIYFYKKKLNKELLKIEIRNFCY